MINRSVLTGRLTREVELKYTPKGDTVGNFTLAVDRNYKNQNNEREADFVNCVIWRKSAENFANFTHKGSFLSAVDIEFVLCVVSEQLSITSRAVE